MDKNYGFVKVAAAVPLCAVADTRHNCTEIAELIKKAYAEGAHAVVFPELCVTGYSCGDLFFSKTLQDGAYKGISYILDETKNLDIVSIVGLPVFDGVHLLNCAAVLLKGKILGIVPKTYIPNYGEFYEGRWFAPADKASKTEIELCGQTVPITSNLIFDFGDMKIAVEICEDMWASTPPSALHAISGANLIFNLSATNAVIGKSGYRKLLVKQRSFTSHCGYVFVSAGAGESTTDTLYSSHVLIGENGAVLTDETPMTFESKIFYSEIDLQRLEADRKKNTGFCSVLKPASEYKTVKADFNGTPITSLSRDFSRFPFVPGLKSDKDTRMSEIYDILAMSLAKRLRHTGIKSPVLGISGGLDSTLALLVAVRSMDILKLERKNIIAVTMPGFGTTDRTLENAKRLIAHLGATLREISIKDACIQHFKDIGHDINNTDIIYENSQARERTQILMDIANQSNGIVVGTGDLSELALGWATYAGDHISMYAVNCGVPKTLVRHLVSWIGESVLEGEVKKIIADILDTPISPELLPAGENGKIAQKTEEILGDYVLHDFFLYYFMRFGFTPQKILFIAKKAFLGEYDEIYIKNCLKTFFTRFFNNQFKRSCMPDGPKIGSVSLSPRADWRMPSDAEARLWLEEL
ncbi:MAG: Glutamine-dependent NAD(+) synthetase [Firmicutes bacterium ADurb.Bin193]|nr:MAG: Glutamine-dependent NAD(+) synthetase [Firmicutes bacterium ADurb.Bin193]